MGRVLGATMVLAAATVLDTARVLGATMVLGTVTQCIFL